MFNIFKFNNKKQIKKDELIFYILCEKYGSYTTTQVKKELSIDDIIFKYKSSSNNKYDDVLIYNNFNSLFYPFFDIDDIDKYNHFCDKTTYKYVAIRSSPDHYWIIVDEPFKSFSDFLKSDIYFDWIVYCDTKYTTMIKQDQKMYFRGFYENLERKPIIMKPNDNYSDNFNMFVDNLDNYYDNEALVISTLKFRDTEMLTILNRKKKLNRILE